MHVILNIPLLQRTLVISNVFVTKDFAEKIEFSVEKKLNMDPSKARITDIFESSFIQHRFCVFVRIASARRF